MRRTQRIVAAYQKARVAAGHVAVCTDPRCLGCASTMEQAHANVEAIMAARAQEPRRFHQGQPVAGFGAFRSPGVVVHVLGAFVAVRWDDQKRASVYSAKTAAKMLIVHAATCELRVPMGCRCSCGAVRS